MNLFCDVMSFSFVGLLSDLETLQMLYDMFDIGGAKVSCPP
jgi:hypothetical protein